MNEKSLVGGSRRAAAVAAMPEGSALAELAGAGAVVLAEAGVEAAGAGARGGPNEEARPGFPPKRPPERLSQPSTLSLKKSVRTIRLEVMPPCEWPASQNALMFSLPSCSMTKLTMLCKYSSSASVHTRVGEFGVRRPADTCQRNPGAGNSGAAS